MNLSKNIPFLIAAKKGHNFHFCFWYLVFDLSKNLNKLIKLFGLSGNIYILWSSFKCSQEKPKKIDFKSLKHELWPVSFFMHRTVSYMRVFRVLNSSMIDGLTDRPTDGPTDQRTNGRTDKASDTVACLQLKKEHDSLVPRCYKKKEVTWEQPIYNEA